MAQCDDLNELIKKQMRFGARHFRASALLVSSFRVLSRVDWQQGKLSRISHRGEQRLMGMAERSNGRFNEKGDGRWRRGRAGSQEERGRAAGER